MHQALGDFLAHRGDPLAAARAAARADPSSVPARLLEASLLICSRDARNFEAAGWAYAALTKLASRSPQEEAHVRAIGAAIDGDLPSACRLYDEILSAAPLDALALAVAQVFDYYLGNPQSMLARSTKALRFWNEAMPSYHAVLSLHAYALQECGRYAAAERSARAALELEPRDVRAHHAIAHVLEMQGRFEEGVRWMGERSALWQGAGAASTHLWWHLALYHVELGRPAHALAIHDRRIQGEGLSELIDASALLWRLHLLGVDTGDRFATLAARWAPYAEDAYCAFNDLHAMMAFAGAGRGECMARLLAAQERRVAHTRGANYDMTRLVGLPACRALAAFAHDDYASAEALLRALPPVAHRIGGSHAQRDVLSLTRHAAAYRKRTPWRAPLVIRALTPDDAPRVQEFVRRLSAQARLERFFSPIRELTARQLERLTRRRDRRDLHLAAFHRDTIVAIAQCAVEEGSAEFAVAVADAWQRSGIGEALVQQLAAHARAEGLTLLQGFVRRGNRAMLALAAKLGFRKAAAGDADLVRVELPLAAA